MAGSPDRSRLAGLAAFDATEKLIFRAYDDRRYAEALALTRASYDRFPDVRARLAFWAACFASLLGETDAALLELERGLRHGSWWSPRSLDDPDLDAIRADPRFAAIVEQCERRHRKAQADACVELAIGDSDIEPPPLLLALPMHGSNPWETLPRWEACESRALVVAVGSSQPLGPRDRCWDDPDASRDDVRTALHEAMTLCCVDGRVVLGGASQGGARAVQFSLEGTFAGVRGFVAVVPTFGLDITVRLDEIAPLVPAAAASGMRGAFILGTADHFLAQAEAVVATVEEAGMPVRVIRLEGMGHEYPAPEVLGEALDFVLA